MKRTSTQPRARAQTLGLIVAVVLLMLGVAIPFSGQKKILNDPKHESQVQISPREVIDSSGYVTSGNMVTPWQPNASLDEIRSSWQDIGVRGIEQIDRAMVSATRSQEQLELLITKAALLNFEGQPKKAHQVLALARGITEQSEFAAKSLSSMMYFQGITALRQGETDNCIMCRGESSSILPISTAARHTNPEGSRLAICHFTEYLKHFPDDLEARWLLNVAHMTLGEHPDKVDPRYLVLLDHFQQNEFDIGRFRDIGHIVGLNHLTQAGGAIMEDFDNDGLLDIIITSTDPTEQMRFLRNTGTGTFEDRTEGSGLIGQLGGLNCMQTDYNNDGRMDIFVVRGAWLPMPMRPSLLRNDGDGKFTDVTEDAGLLHSMNSIAASWADYDNDGWLDLFVCGERQTSRLYHNLGNGTFEEVASKAGVTAPETHCKGAAWIDFDNDDYPDLFLNYLTYTGAARLFRNNHDGTFRDVTRSMGIDGPSVGFSCWAWDYDNDGWLDIFATCFDRSLADVVKGLQGEPHSRNHGRLYRNVNGKTLQDTTKEAGLDLVLSTMGSNFGDFDNDGYLDMYLGTGEPDLTMLVPNRMFKNVAGERFSEITASSGTGNLQKGHGVACGDWDRDGNIDIFIEMGGVTNGDKYHNILFQNPGHHNNWLTVKLTGEKSNRAAIGARIKITTAGDQPRTVYRHVSSGSSFGASPLQQTIGVGKAERIAKLEIHWPTSGTTQVFRDIDVNQAIAITEQADDYQKLDWKPIAIQLPEPHAKMNSK